MIRANENKTQIMESRFMSLIKFLVTSVTEQQLIFTKSFSFPEKMLNHPK